VTELTYLFASVAVLTGLMTMISIWAPRQLWLKFGAVGTAALFLPAAYGGFLHLLSMPKPVALEWWHATADEATVLGSRISEGDGIYLWLQINGVREPRAYVLPWDRDLAEQLQTAQREAEENQTQLQMRMPFEHSLDDQEPKFYAMPQPRLPSKDELEPPQTYSREATEA
jgi:alkylation response protein AidB-like acyl-CoA dehydrogenase